MSSQNNEFPDIIPMGRGMTMTFLHNEHYLTRNYIASDANDFYVPPHWHETHDEILRVLEGKLEIMLGSETNIYGPEDREVLVAKGVVHSLKSVKGVETVFVEKTDPMDDEKEMFFRNIIREGGLPTSILEVMHIFYYSDTIPALPGHVRWLEKGLLAFLGYYVAPLLGHKRKYLTLKKAL